MHTQPRPPDLIFFTSSPRRVSVSLAAVSLSPASSSASISSVSLGWGEGEVDMCAPTLLPPKSMVDWPQEPR